MDLSVQNWKPALEHGFDLESSGTTGTRKTVFQTPAKLAAANLVALDAQHITRRSRVLTVCSMDHAGGLLAQTLPALSIGAYVDIKPFNAYRFWRDLDGFTHTHLTPAHCQALIATKGMRDVDLTGLYITCGSDSVPFDSIRAFVQAGARFMCNWGMTEVGPIAINTEFNSIEQVAACEQLGVSGGSLMGDRYYCSYKIIDECLYVQGDICVYDGWFDTQDIVQLNSTGAMYHMGRRHLKKRS